VATGILAIRAIRRRTPYELWYLLLMASYLVLLLSYGHQLADGQELTNGGVIATVSGTTDTSGAYKISPTAALNAAHG
jgi:hypothetical protein